MDLGKNADHIVAGAALLASAGTLYYSYKNIQDIKDEIYDNQDRWAEADKKTAQFSGQIASIERALNASVEKDKNVKVTFANMQQEIGDLRQEMEELKGGITQWSTEVTDSVRGINPDSTLEDFALEPVDHRPPQSRTRFQQQSAMRGGRDAARAIRTPTRRPHPYERAETPQTRAPSRASTRKEDDEAVAEFRAANQQAA